jgi:hypothetical protein
VAEAEAVELVVEVEVEVREVGLEWVWGGEEGGVEVERRQRGKMK